MQHNNLGAMHARVKHEIRQMRLVEKQIAEGKRNERRQWSDWRRNKNLVLACCVLQLSGKNAASISVCKAILRAELKHALLSESTADVIQFLEAHCEKNALVVHCRSIRDVVQKKKPWITAAELLLQCTALPGLARASSRGLVWNGNRLVEEMLAGGSPEMQALIAPRVAGCFEINGNKRKQLIRRMRRRWSLDYTTLNARCYVDTDVQANRASASVEASHAETTY